MINYPDSPTVGQQFTAAGITWVWDGVKWAAMGTGPGVAQAIGDNRIINGDMRIDQRNNGASGTASGYTVDRWQYGASQAAKGTWGRATPGAPDFPYILAFTSTSAYASLATDSFSFQQLIEADMISDFRWGTSSAQPVTLSFWAYCSTNTGTFSGSLCNSNSPFRSYPFSFSITAINTWAKFVIVIPGDTAGAWTLTGNGVGLYVRFDLGCGSNFRAAAGSWQTGNFIGVTGAVSVVAINNCGFGWTGIKLEIGSVATPFNHYSLAKCMADCQRYYQTGYLQMNAYSAAGAAFAQTIPYIVTPRVVPTIVLSGQAYSNCSGAVAQPAGVNGFVGYAFATALGTASWQFNYTVSAEL